MCTSFTFANAFEITKFTNKKTRNKFPLYAWCYQNLTVWATCESSQTL